MKTKTFPEFVFMATGKNFIAAPWQEQLMIKERWEIFPGMPRRNMRWEFHWTMQLMWMRAQWVKGNETRFSSPNFELLSGHVTYVVFDEWNEL